MENLIDEPWLMDKENRRNTLSALWGIVRAWHEAGSRCKVCSVIVFFAT